MIGSTLVLPYYFALKAEALHLAHRASEALEAIKQAEAQAERFGEGWWWCAELHRLRGVFITAIGAKEAQIDTSFCTAIRIAREQKSVSLEIAPSQGSRRSAEGVHDTVGSPLEFLLLRLRMPPFPRGRGG